MVACLGVIHNVKCVDILEIARYMLEGELAYRKGEFEAAFGKLRKGVELELGLP